MLLTCASGAITALGDTLFPVDVTDGQGLFARIRDDLSATQHFLVRLRIAPPILALLAALYMFWMAVKVLDHGHSVTHKWARWLMGLVAVQVGLGFLNIALGAPTWLQLAHLAVADLTWIALVILIGATYRPVAHTPESMTEAIA